MNYQPDSGNLNFSEQDLNQINRRILHNKETEKQNRANASELIQLLIKYRDTEQLRQLETISLSIFEQLIYTFGISDEQLAEIFSRSMNEIRRYHFKCDLARDAYPKNEFYTTILPVLDVKSFAEYFHISYKE